MRARREFIAVVGTALLFVLLSPVFWHAVESPSAEASPVAVRGAAPLDALLPAYTYLNARVQAGELPLWWGEPGFGVPFHACPAHAVFSPARVLDLALDAPTALASIAMVHVLLAGLTMLLLLRGLDVSWTGALPGSVAYAFSGSMAGSMSLPGAGAAYAIAPLLFWGAYITVTRGELGGVWCSAVALGLAMLCGSVDKPLAFWLMATLWMAMLCPFLRGRPRWRRTLLWSAATLGVAMLIALVQLLPTLLWALQVEHPLRLLRGAPLPGAPPSGALGLLKHLLHPQEGATPPLGYLGASLLWLAVPALAGWRRRLEAYALGGVALILTVAAATGATRDIPLLSTALMLYLMPLPGACLVGIGAARLLSPGIDPRAREAWMPLLAGGAVWLALVVISGGQARAWLLLAGLMLAPALLLRWKWLGALSAMALAALAFVELANVSTNYHGHPFFAARAAAPAPAPVLSRAKELALDGRVLLAGAEAEALSNQALANGMRMLVPGSPYLSRKALKVLDIHAPEDPFTPQRARRLAGLNVHALVTRTDAAPDARAAGEHPWRLAATFPPLAVHVQDTPGRIQWWGSYDESEGNITPRAVTGPPAATWQTVWDAPEHVELIVNAASDGALVLAGYAAPGWSVYLDGAKAPLLRAEKILRAVAVPAGDHQVRFVYRPWPLYAGGVVSMAALGGACIAMLAELLRRRPVL